MKVSTEIDNNFGYEKITQLVDNIPLRESGPLMIFKVKGHGHRVKFSGEGICHALRCPCFSLYFILYFQLTSILKQRVLCRMGHRGHDLIVVGLTTTSC